MGSGVEFQEDDESLDPILTRPYVPVAAPLLSAFMMKAGLAKNLRQANAVLMTIALVSFTVTFSLIADAFMKTGGELEKYPAQDVSKGV